MNLKPWNSAKKFKDKLPGRDCFICITGIGETILKIISSSDGIETKELFFLANNNWGGELEEWLFKETMLDLLKARAIRQIGHHWYTDYFGDLYLINPNLYWETLDFIKAKFDSTGSITDSFYIRSWEITIYQDLSDSKLIRVVIKNLDRGIYDSWEHWNTPLHKIYNTIHFKCDRADNLIPEKNR